MPTALSPMAAAPGAATDNAPGADVVVPAKDLPAFCPNPRMPLWSSHPRVYLDLAATGDAMCPYCGTRYRLADGPGAPAGH